MGAALGMGRHLIGQPLQRIQFCPQFIQQILCIAQGHLRLQLSGDAAHIFAALDNAIVAATVLIAGLPPYDTAHIVTHVLVSHIASIGTALDHTAGKTGNTADISTSGHALCGTQQRKVRQIRRHFHSRGVDFPIVAALDQASGILPGQASRIVLAGHCALEPAVDQLAGGLIEPHKAAYQIVPLHGAFKGTVHHLAVVGASDTADGIAGAAGRHQSHHLQAIHHGTFLQCAEKPGVGVLPCKGKSADGVVVALKSAAEGGNGQKALRLLIQSDILIQNHGFPLGPGVQTAILCQIAQIVLRLNVNGAVPGFTGKGQRREQKAHPQSCGQNGGHPPHLSLVLVIPLHLCPPPTQRLRSG